MDSNELMLVGLLLLAALSVAAIVFLLINPYLSGEHRTDKRIQGGHGKPGKANRDQDAGGGRQQSPAPRS